jgi:hypothetical protein
MPEPVEIREAGGRSKVGESRLKLDTRWEEVEI